MSATIENFVPFPENYFMYDFPKPFDGKTGAKFILIIKGHSSFAIGAKIMQSIDLGDIIRAQVTTTDFFHIDSNGSFKKIAISSNGIPISEHEKVTYKNLLKTWDPEEFSDERNYYFQRIDDENSAQGFCNLIGGAICRPGKFPFDSVSTQAKSIMDRINVLTESKVEQRLKLLKQIIIAESSLTLKNN